MAPLLKPALYSEAGTEAARDLPALIGGLCSCGYVFFPFQSYGCEKCGGLDLKETPLSGRGTLIASARVHLHPGKGREAPFTIGSIRLDDGPVVRTLVDGDVDRLRPGVRMKARLAEATTPEGESRLDLRFVAEDAQ